jgi:hypothetical protein
MADTNDNTADISNEEMYQWVVGVWKAWASISVQIQMIDHDGEMRLYIWDEDCSSVLLEADPDHVTRESMTLAARAWRNAWMRGCAAGITDAQFRMRKALGL